MGPEIIKIDILHTWNLGIGGDLASSSLMSLAQMKLWGGRSIQARLDVAYESFSAWCAMNGKTANIKSFELGKFKMVTFLVLITGRPQNCGKCFLFLCFIAREQSLWKL